MSKKKLVFNEKNLNGTKENSLDQVVFLKLKFKIFFLKLNVFTYKLFFFTFFENLIRVLNLVSFKRLDG